MNQFLGSIIVTALVMVTFLFVVRNAAMEDISPPATIDFTDRTRAVFTDDIKGQSQKLPFIIEAVIQEESLDSVTIDVSYYVPEDRYEYGLEVRPERSDFNVDERTIKAGFGAERVTIFFAPQSIFKRRIVTEYLIFSIDSFGKRNVDKTYVRKVNFIKEWRKQKYKGLFLRRSEYKTF